jgi:hypothetical protein
MSAILRTGSLVGAVLILFAAGVAGGATIKKWVDENGVTHYGTSIPPEYRDQAHSELNKRGIEIRRHDRALTPEEIEREKALAALRAEQQKLLEEQQARDRILLNLYRNEDDLVMARDGKIAALDSQIQLTHGEIRRLKSRLSDFQAAAAAAERSGKQVTGQQKANLETTQRSIEKSYAIILGKEDEKRMTVDHYEQDLIRFRQLRQTGSRTIDAERVKTSEIPDLVDTAVRCRDDDECGRLWRIAQEYARAHATTPVDLAAERILVTAPPRAIRDISITVSRLEDPAQGGERIFMDVQCANFTEAREFCRGPDVSRIRSGFRAALLLP